MTTRRGLAWGVRVVLLSSLLVSALWAFWYEPASLEVNYFSVTPADWPVACDGLSIAVLADLHAGAPHIDLDKIAEVVSKTNAAAPDLVLLAGDYVIQGVVGGQFIAPEQAAGLLASLRAPLGVFAVLGNRDWWLDAARVGRALTERGIPLLEDASIALGSNGCQFQLIGINDYWEGAHDMRRAFSSVHAAAPAIVFTHNPDVFPELERRVSLAIAGHTHGGQVALPLLGRPVVPSAYGERFAAGIVHEGEQHYFVSTGIGTSILPVRFRVPPEVSIVVLRAPRP